MPVRCRRTGKVRAVRYTGRQGGHPERAKDQRASGAEGPPVRQGGIFSRPQNWARTQRAGQNGHGQPQMCVAFGAGTASEHPLACSSDAQLACDFHVRGRTCREPGYAGFDAHAQRDSSRKGHRKHVHSRRGHEQLLGHPLSMLFHAWRVIKSIAHPSRPSTPSPDPWQSAPGAHAARLRP